MSAIFPFLYPTSIKLQYNLALKDTPSDQANWRAPGIDQVSAEIAKRILNEQKELDKTRPYWNLAVYSTTLLSLGGTYFLFKRYKKDPTIEHRSEYIGFSCLSVAYVILSIAICLSDFTKDWPLLEDLKDGKREEIDDYCTKNKWGLYHFSLDLTNIEDLKALVKADEKARIIKHIQHVVDRKDLDFRFYKKVSASLVLFSLGFLSLAAYLKVVKKMEIPKSDIILFGSISAIGCALYPLYASGHEKFKQVSTAALKKLNN